MPLITSGTALLFPIPYLSGIPFSIERPDIVIAHWSLAHRGDENYVQILVECLKGRDRLGDLQVDMKVDIKE
jgi:hypothetical protein